VARTTVNIGFTVPMSVAEEFAKLAEEEQCTKSELFRRMFRLYCMYREEMKNAEKEKLGEIASRANKKQASG
jgi:metal-responsive CopG/Arc/MetJ family transcriptional regulator